MIHQIVIPSAAVNSTWGKAYVNGRCKIKIINVYFLTSSRVEDGTSYIADRFYILQSNSLFQSIPNSSVIVATGAKNDFENALEIEANINGDIDLTVLSYSTKLPPSDIDFESLLLTVDITPIA